MSLVGLSRALAANAVIVGSASNDCVVFTANNTQKMHFGASNTAPTLTLSGNKVGIGSSNPQSGLDVATYARLSGIGGSYTDNALTFQRRLATASTSPDYFIGRGGVTANQNHLIIHAPGALSDAGVHVLSSGALSRLFVKQKALPQAAVVNRALSAGSEEYLTVQYDKLVPVLVEAYKSVRRECAELRGECEALRAALCALNTK